MNVSGNVSVDACLRNKYTAYILFTPIVFTEKTADFQFKCHTQTKILPTQAALKWRLIFYKRWVFCNGHVFYFIFSNFFIAFDFFMYKALWTFSKIDLYLFFNNG